MTDKMLYWLAAEESKPIQYADLAGLMASAIHPAHDFAFGAAVVNFEEQLPEAVRSGELVVRNPLDMGRHSFPHGNALKKAVLLPHDLRPFLEARGIELRLTPHGSGPRYWTLENAAIAIAEQHALNDAARRTLLDQLVEAAVSGKLVVRNPHTCLPETSGQIRQYYELVEPSDVNEWLAAVKANFIWQVERSGPIKSAILQQPQGPTALPTTVLANCFSGLHWESPQKWKKPLGDVPKWLEPCRVARGQQGKFEATWNPVLVGAELVRRKSVKAKSVRSRFQSQDPLKPWLDAWVTYEMDHFEG